MALLPAAGMAGHARFNLGPDPVRATGTFTTSVAQGVVEGVTFDPVPGNNGAKRRTSVSR